MDLQGDYCPERRGTQYTIFVPDSDLARNYCELDLMVLSEPIEKVSDITQNLNIIAKQQDIEWRKQNE